MAVKNLDNWRSVWTLLPPSRELLTNLCQYAGVHVYSHGGETLLANDSYVMVHAPNAGPINITLPKEYEVFDCIDNHNLGITKVIQANLPQSGMTKIYRLK
jgi:hypothetical protein